jgi:hypothetical protein
VGVVLDSGNLMLHHNTIFPGHSIYQAAGLLVNGVQKLHVENNLFLGDAGLKQSGIFVTTQLCDVYASFASNVFVGLTLIQDGPPSACSGQAQYSNVSALETELNMSADVGAKGNRTLRAVCTGDPGCIFDVACDGVDPTKCLEKVIVQWSQDDAGYSSAGSGGWALRDGASCAITRSNTDDTQAILTDFAGNTRTFPSSIGAYENDANCKP